MDILGMTTDQLRTKCEQLAELVKRSAWYIEVLSEEIDDGDEQDLMEEQAFLRELRGAIK